VFHRTKFLEYAFFATILKLR